jgi:uncharacterized protein (DUF169 family)
MDWQKWSDRLKKELNLETDPVAVTFAGPQPSGGGSNKEKVSVCQALKKASGGEAVVITAETCGCPGGLVSLGLGQTPPQGKEKLADFLINKEKVYCSRVAMHRSQQTVLPPVGVGSRVSFSPLSKAEASPDVIVFIGKPGSLHHLISFAGYWEGGSMKAELSGPACRTGVAYPAVTGQIGLSLFDFGARRLAGFDESHLLVAIPMHRMIGVISALDQGVGGKREAVRENIEREIDELGGVAPA